MRFTARHADSLAVEPSHYELAGDTWQDRGELSQADRQALEAELAEYERSPDAGSAWD